LCRYAAVCAKLVSHVIDSSQEKARDLIIKLLVACKKDCGVGGEVLTNRSTYQVKPFYLSSETVLPIK
jgi:hypothetical protein